MHYSTLTVVVVKHEGVQLVAVMKLKELVMDVHGVLHVCGVLQSEYQFLLSVI